VIYQVATTGRRIRVPLKKMILTAEIAAQSSADSQPDPPMSATEIPTNAAAEVIASLL
jgi:hypothetical protein